MKIDRLSLFQVEGHWKGPSFPPGSRQARAIDLYPEFNLELDYSPRSGDLHREFYVEIRTDEDLSGLFGPIDSAQVFVIRDELGPFLLGRDPLATEALHDQMLRLNRHGRSGLFMTGLSALDCALWDLKGKVFAQPVYRLLGGPTRFTADHHPAEVPVYASMLSYSIEPEQAAETATAFKSQGFSAQKWFFRYGPADGVAGKERNLAMARAVRQAVGWHYPLMFDAFMGWDFPYALEMMKDLAPLQPTWVEEPLPPERVESLHQLRTLSGVPLATGEHIYTRWQVKALLMQQAVDYIQTDPDWTGGITEQVKICALASAFDVPVVAHGHSLLPALHVAAAQSPAVVPYVEYLFIHQEGKQYFHNPIYRPANGGIRLPDLPGLGLVLDLQKIEEKTMIVAIC